MKKMTFALACASTLALFADEWQATKADFEAEALVGKTVSLKDDSGSDSGDVYWQYKGASGSDDQSFVKNYVKEGKDKPQGTQLSGLVGDNYLELSTEGGTLWRSFKANAADLGEAKAISADKEGLFIDTMVQFTATEDNQAPETAEGDKLAIWLAKDGDNATLMVKAMAYDDEFTPSATAFALVPVEGNLSIQDGTWYRLTVKARKSIMTIGEETQSLLPGFEIFVDGIAMKTTGAVFTSEAAATIKAQMDESAQGLLDAGRLFPSLQGMVDAFNEETGAPNDVTLQAVGFKGSGAIDDLVLTDENPIKDGPEPEPAETEFTIATAEGVTASWSTTADGEFKPYVVGEAKADPGKIYVKLATADGGVKVVEQTVVEGETNAFDLTSETANDWSWYLGDADADGAFIVDDAGELKKLAAKLATLGSAGITFKLGADIDMSDEGTFPGIGSTGAENIATATTGMFQGTFDGDDHTISNLKLPAVKGSGLFNTICGAAKIMNLTVDTVTYDTITAEKLGGAMLVGIMSGGTIENCTTKGANASASNPITYNAAGIVNRIETRLGAVTIKDCTNEAAIYCKYTKIAGICPIVEMSGATGDVTFENCVNKGAITAVGDTWKASDGKDKTPGADGCAGIIGYSQTAVAGKAIKIKDCKDQGTLVGSKACCGGILAKVASGNITDMGGNQTKDTVPAIKSKGGTITGFAFATVADGVATYVADSEAKAGADLKVMLAGKTVTLAKGESITLDMTIATATVAAADAENDKITQSGNVYTCEAKVIAVTPVVTLSATTAEFSDTLALPTVTVEGDYVENTDYTVAWDKELPKENPAEDVVLTATVTMTGKYSGSATATFTVTPKTVTYPEYIAEADKAKYDAWVEANGVTDRVDTDKALQAAYLLNVAPAEAKDEAAKFAIKSITIDAEGNVTVEAPAKNSKGADFNGTVEVLGATALDGEWAAKAAGHKFFKAVLK